MWFDVDFIALIETDHLIFLVDGGQPYNIYGGGNKNIIDGTNFGWLASCDINDTMWIVMTNMMPLHILLKYNHRVISCLIHIYITD